MARKANRQNTRNARNENSLTILKKTRNVPGTSLTTRQDTDDNPHVSVVSEVPTNTIYLHESQ